MTDALEKSLAGWRAALGAGLAPFGPRVTPAGSVVHVNDGIAIVRGLDDLRVGERVECHPLNGDPAVPAQVGAIGTDGVACILLGDDSGLSAGASVKSAGEPVDIPVGSEMLGRVVDPLGNPLDGLPPPATTARLPAERAPPPILDRDLVTRALHTGSLVVDALMPLGRGQRELVVGDRRTGKSTLVLDAILSQAEGDVVCVHASIGQRSAATLHAVETVRAHGRLGNCVFVVAPADAPAGQIWLAPFSACSIAEHFRDAGRDVLLVIDDLTKHASIHRQIGLLLRNPPGREAFPGDTFYLHARLLERAAQLSPERGGGSLAILAVSETQGGDIAGYIPTNLISIVDGQIVCDSRLWGLGQRPAVDVARSVSRVGGRAQPPALRALASTLKLEYAQFLELEDFSRFGGLADVGAAARIAHGARIRRVLAQPPNAPLDPVAQFVLLFAVTRGLFDPMPLAAVDRLRTHAAAIAGKACPTLAQTISGGGTLPASEEAALVAEIGAFLSRKDENGIGT